MLSKLWGARCNKETYLHRKAIMRIIKTIQSILGHSKTLQRTSMEQSLSLPKRISKTSHKIHQAKVAQVKDMITHQ
jgi:hypothetical protein